MITLIYDQIWINVWNIQKVILQIQRRINALRKLLVFRLMKIPWGWHSPAQLWASRQSQLLFLGSLRSTRTLPLSRLISGLSVTHCSSHSASVSSVPWPSKHTHLYSVIDCMWSCCHCDSLHCVGQNYYCCYCLQGDFPGRMMGWLMISRTLTTSFPSAPSSNWFSVESGWEQIHPLLTNMLMLNMAISSFSVTRVQLLPSILFWDPSALDNLELCFGLFCPGIILTHSVK